MAFSYAALIQGFSNFFQGLESSIPERYRVIISLLLYTIFIVIYSVFIWKFYRFMAKREIISLNLSQYDYSKYPNFGKFIETVSNIIEYAIILPFLVLFWFTVFSIFLLLLSKTASTYQILVICVAIISSTRVTAYMTEDLSKDIAKIFPFTVLALFLLEPDFFKINVVFERITQIPELLGNILIFLVFIFGIELFLRVVYSITRLFSSASETEDEKTNQK